MIFGGVNSSQYVGDLHNFPLKTNTWWALDFKEIGYKDYVIQTYNPSDNAIAVVDTGTSLAAIPQDIHDELSKRWKSEVGMNIFYCQDGLCFSGEDCESTGKSMSPINMVIGEYQFMINPKGYLIDGADIEASLAGICLVALMPHPPNIFGGFTMFLLGDTFLRNFYSVYDYDD